MADYRVFLPEVLPNVPGCPDITVTGKAELVVRDFCDRTEVWKEWRDIYFDPGVDRYEITAPQGSEIGKVASVVYNNRAIEAVSSTGPGVDDNNFEAGTGNVRDGWLFEPPNYLRLASVPEDEGLLFLSLVLRPQIGYGSFPDWIWSNYWRYLASGVSARLLMQRGMAWSQPDLAVVYMREFENGISNVKRNISKGFSNRSLKVKPRRFV